MKVRAKFKCQSNVSGVVILHPVTSGSEENKSFWKYTPGGCITLTITNPEAVQQFEVEKEYYVDFTLAEEAPKEPGDTINVAGEDVPVVDGRTGK